MGTARAHGVQARYGELEVRRFRPITYHIYKDIFFDFFDLFSVVAHMYARARAPTIISLGVLTPQSKGGGGGVT